MLNGARKGDRNGKYTCFTASCPSMVDIGLVSGQLGDLATNFDVQNLLADISDHCSIQATLGHPSTTPKDDSTAKVDLLDTAKLKIIWFQSIRKEVEKALGRPSFKCQLNEILNSLDRERSAEALDRTIEVINTTTLSHVQNSCSCRDISYNGRTAKKHRSKINKPWFNKACGRLRDQKRNSGKKFGKKNEMVADRFRASCHHYKRVKRQAVKSFKRKIVRSMYTNDYKNPKEWWKSLKSLNPAGKASDDISETNISLSEWLGHFQLLLSPDLTDTSSMFKKSFPFFHCLFPFSSTILQYTPPFPTHFTLFPQIPPVIPFFVRPKHFARTLSPPPPQSPSIPSLHNHNLSSLIKSNPFVVNLSFHILTPEQTSLLSKGLNFCPTPGDPDLADVRNDLDRVHQRLRQKQHFLHLKEADTPSSSPSQSDLLSHLFDPKATFFDNIDNTSLKCLQVANPAFLSCLFSIILDSGLFPSEWAKAYLTPLHKKGSRENPQNYIEA